MGYLKMQGGEWLVTGRCSSPKFRRVGKNHTPFCTVGIAAGTNPKELDEQGRPKPIWINITACHGPQRGCSDGDRRAVHQRV